MVCLASNKSYFPGSVVFLPSDESRLLYIERTAPGVIDFITESAVAGLAVDAIIQKVLIKFGISLTPALVTIALSSGFFSFYKKVDLLLFSTAYSNSNSGKVRVDFTTIDGWPVNQYYSWGSNYVTDSPWEDYEPVFYQGVYSFAT